MLHMTLWPSLVPPLPLPQQAFLAHTHPLLACRMRHAVHVCRWLEQWQQPPTPPVPGQPQRGRMRRGGPQILTCPPPFTRTSMAKVGLHFIKLDDRVLHWVCKQLGLTKETLAAFTAEPALSHHWARWFNTGKLCSLTRASTGKLANKWFHFLTVKTDGVSVCMHYTRPLPPPPAPPPAAGPSSSNSSRAAAPSAATAATHVLGLPRIGKALAKLREFVFDPATQLGVGIGPGVTQAVSAVGATTAQDRALEQFFKKLEKDMVEVSMERHGRAKQLVVFFGATSIGTGGGWGADAVLRACCKVVCRPRGTDQLRGRVVLMDEHRTTWVSSAVHGQEAIKTVDVNDLQQRMGQLRAEVRRKEDVAAAAQRSAKAQRQITEAAHKVKQASGLSNARRTTQRWLAPIKPRLQHLAAASSAGTSLEANLKHVITTLATGDAVCEVYLDLKWARQRLRLYGSQDRALEQFFKKLEGDMAEVSMERHGRAKQLVVFFGAASIGTRGGWGADAVLRAYCKVVCRPRGTDQLRGRVVLVDEHRTTRVNSAVNGKQPCKEKLDHKPPQAPCSSQAATQPASSEPGPSTPPPAKRSKRTKAEQAAEPTQPTEGKAAKAKPTPQPGRWLDRDCNAALNMQRIGESRWRPLELCYWPDQGALPAKGKEYPGLGYKRLRDKPPTAQQQQQPAAAQ
ncbi:hypothetical protein QJQ45_010066 [Haematococcus lacustris]|nr:hypothetical protein QJQ45_010066 [Haematococcus lacustris]